jgi:hypothetical protein
MSFLAAERTGISNQRGFWLRYFLESEDHLPAGSSGRSALKGHDFCWAMQPRLVLKGHDFCRAMQPRLVLKGHDFSRAMQLRLVLKGHDFSRAANHRKNRGFSR